MALFLIPGVQRRQGRNTPTRKVVMQSASPAEDEIFILEVGVRQDMRAQGLLFHMVY